MYNFYNNYNQEFLEKLQTQSKSSRKKSSILNNRMRVYESIENGASMYDYHNDMEYNNNFKTRRGDIEW